MAVEESDAMKLRPSPNIDENVDHLGVGLELFRQLVGDQVVPVGTPYSWSN
jgi:hypothetical protein